MTTRSGGPGTSTVQFRGYHETIGPMKESAVWVEEAPMQSFVWGRRTLSPTNYQQEDPLGLSVEGNEYVLINFFEFTEILWYVTLVAARSTLRMN